MPRLSNKHIDRSLSILSLLIILLSAGHIAKADIYERPNKHVIISFDTAVPFFANDLRDKAHMERGLQQVINKLDLNDEDYISLVNFGISGQTNNLRELGRTIKDRSGKPISWVPFTTLHDALSMGEWSDMIDRQGIAYTARHGAAFSMLTGSKAYTLQSQRPHDSFGNIAGETYLVMVTDDNYNGCDDINKEFSMMYSPYLSQSEFLGQCRDVSEYYNFYYEKDLSNEYLASRNGLDYKAMVFKVLPSSNMALSSVVDYPANLGLKRVKGGYQIDFDFQHADKDYFIRRLEVSYKDKDGNRHEDTYTYKQKEEDNNPQHISLFVPHSHIRGNKLEVDLKGWLQQTDSVYGAAMLNPNSEDFGRLNVSTVLNIKNDAKAFGLFPIPDMLWIGNEVTTQIQVWNIIIALLALWGLYKLFMRLVKKYAKYVPANSVISMYMREAPKSQVPDSQQTAPARPRPRKKKTSTKKDIRKDTRK